MHSNQTWLTASFHPILSVMALRVLFGNVTCSNGVLWIPKERLSGVHEDVTHRFVVIQKKNWLNYCTVLNHLQCKHFNSASALDKEGKHHESEQCAISLQLKCWYNIGSQTRTSLASPSCALDGNSRYFGTEQGLKKALARTNSSGLPSLPDVRTNGNANRDARFKVRY